MAYEYRLPPSASSLVASMRDLGYSFETAIADLIDNSITAESSTLEIFCDLASDCPAIVIIDNGIGMKADEVVAAMRHGSTSPRKDRSSSDLGRFGLGMKTASFSQCRRMTVVSAQGGKISGAEWDLDLVDDRDDWVISVQEPQEIYGLPYVDRLRDNGTIVIWRTLDRLFENETGRKRDEIVNDKLDRLEKHLSLVFHRFISGEFKNRKKLAISINGHIVEPFDPFCRKNTATQILPEEIVKIGEEIVRLQPFILPHHSKLTAREYDYYQSRSDFISNQGIYVYRDGRLIAWGDWFRIIAKGEKTKLARVQIDFPNSLDDSWIIDIKKSYVRAPQAVKERLRQILLTIVERSSLVHSGRGRRLYEEVEAPIWERYADHGSIRYALNREHPLVEALAQLIDEAGFSKLETYMTAISSSLPIDTIYSDFSTHPKMVQQSDIEDADIIKKLFEFKDFLFSDTKGDAEVFRKVVQSTRLFDKHLTLMKEFINKEFAQS